jgi:prepilin signal peptidase PulO-like enzyme (type II secretory pathway)
MGFGDAKLGFGLGTLLGFWGALNAVILAFWSGALVGLALIALSKLGRSRFFRHRFSIKSEIPFAPFLVLGLVLNLFWGLTIFVF